MVFKGHKFPVRFGFSGSANKVYVKPHFRGKAQGGVVHKDEAADKAMVRSMVKPSALKKGKP